MSSLLQELKNEAVKKPNKSILPDSALNKLINSKHTVFFAGAGFSKAWSSDYPLGFSLFSITDLTTLKKKYNFLKIADSLCIDVPKSNSDDFDKECYEYFSEIKFHLDIYKRYPSLMPTFLNLTLIEALEQEIKLFIKERFVSLVGDEELQVPASDDSKHVLIPFFELLFQKGCFPAIITTNYDYIFEKILNSLSEDITLNRGVIDKARFDNKEWHKNKVDLFKLNGGFEIHKNDNGSFCADYDIVGRAPNIILPSQEQNYDDKYFKTVFVKSAEKLREAHVLVFIGYSLPKEDHTIRFLLKNFVDSKALNKEIIIVGRNLAGAKEVHEKASLLFPSIAEAEGIYALDGSINDLVIKT